MTTKENQLKNTSHFQGEAAIRQLNLCLERAFDEDALGGVVGYDWDNGLMTTTRIDDPNDSRLYPSDEGYVFPLVIVDSGNVSGDLWKYIFHPLTQTGMFCSEAR